MPHTTPTPPDRPTDAAASATAVVPDPRAAAHAEREQRRLDAWRRRVARSPRFDNLRTPRATRALIAIYLGGFAIGIVAMPLDQILPGENDNPARAFTFLAIYLGGLLIGCAAWAVLRCTIDLKDSAPDSALDEYESEVLARWRRIGFKALSWLTLAFGSLLAFFGGWFPASFPFDTASLITGVALLLVCAVCSTIPAIGYALAFNASGDADTQAAR